MWATHDCEHGSVGTLGRQRIQRVDQPFGALSSVMTSDTVQRTKLVTVSRYGSEAAMALPGIISFVVSIVHRLIEFPNNIEQHGECHWRVEIVG